MPNAWFIDKLDGVFVFDLLNYLMIDKIVMWTLCLWWYIVRNLWWTYVDYLLDNELVVVLNCAAVGSPKEYP